MKFNKTALIIIAVIALASTYYIFWEQDLEATEVSKNVANAWNHPGLSPTREQGSLAAEHIKDEAKLIMSASSQNPEFHDLCGLGRITASSNPGQVESQAEGPWRPLAHLPMPIGDYALEDARKRTIFALSSGDSRQRGAALILGKPAESDTQAMSTWAKNFYDEAMKSRDPQVLRWAAMTCPYMNDGPACRHTLVRERVQLEPANAAHWMDLASEDPDATQEAWQGLEKAHYWREAPLAITGATQRMQTQGVPGYLQGAIMDELSNIEAARGTASLELLHQRCSPASDAQSGCERVAQIMMEHSDSMTTLWQGRKLAKGLGFSADQLAKADRELKQLGQDDLKGKIDQHQSLNCASIESRSRFAMAVEQQGERAVLRNNLTAVTQNLR